MAESIEEKSETQEDTRNNLNIAIVTDAWLPQVNGVVTTYRNTFNQLREMGHYFYAVEPTCRNDLRRISLPGYKEIEVVINPWRIKPGLEYFIEQGWKIHVATEGPLGLYARYYLTKRKYPFTTCYHSKFPEFIQARTGIKSKWFYPYFRWFHKPSKCVMVPSREIKNLLEAHDFTNVEVWTRGVDPTVFKPTTAPIGNYILCVSRVSKEKNLDAFCELDYPYKILVGDGPYLKELSKKYPDVVFAGKLTGDELADMYARARCFVFPSTEDTFGVVLLESIACGTPVAAYPCPGAKEVIEYSNGEISEYLQDALMVALTKSRTKVYETSKAWTWRRATEEFIKNISKDQ